MLISFFAVMGTPDIDRLRAKDVGKKMSEKMSKEMKEMKWEVHGQTIEPPITFQEQLVFPYLDGYIFVEEAYAKDGNNTLERLWTDPPASTEQVLHPERYLEALDPPVEVPAPAPLDRRRRLMNDVLGELEVRLLLRSHLDEEQAAQAATGWGGDRYVAEEDGRGREVRYLWRTEWDTDEDAIQFREALVEVYEARGLDPASVAESVHAATWWTGSGETGWATVSRRGRRVVAAEGRSDLKITRGRLWSDW